ncbi:MAG: type I DNA topoisomerase, partial [Ruminococcus sp.]|nr:type I DNA topoisomerase [Ruminococcus sp.]
EYWSVDARFTDPPSRKVFTASLALINNEKPELDSKDDVDKILKDLEGAEFVVSAVKKSVRRRSPAPPFTTSTLQQEASKRLSFQGRRTMKAAQELYEGVDIKDMGPTGLITYMRTDSTRISDEARAAAYDYIGKTYGEEYIPKTPNKYKSRGSAQDGHEAIRPSHPELTPALVKGSLTNDQYKLYKLIWERFMASQMAKCVMDNISVYINAGSCTFKSSGFSVKFDGFTVLYEETGESEAAPKNDLTAVKKDDILRVRELNGNQHFTQPPARYTEATLVKAFEETGIGRPSTYVPTISTILNRNYVERDGKSLKPTSLGEVTNQLMSEHFDKIVDVKFTANMEDDLDKVENGTMQWTDTLRSFYAEFENELENAESDMEGKRVKVPDEETDQVCDECGKPMVIKIGRYGKFMACTGFPECRFTKPIMHETGADCPYCGKKVLLKKSKRGKVYYGCEDNPNCRFMTWDIPTNEKCPTCGSSLFQKGGKNGKLICHKEGCGYSRDIKND